MDTALKLKADIDNGKIFSKEEIIGQLVQSVLVRELTADFPEKPLTLVWRLIGISQIPFSHYLEYTQNLIGRVYEKLATPFGFSLSGDEKMFLPCYNAMVVSALCRLNRATDPQVKSALEWINKNQPMERGVDVNLPGFRFDRFGGCFGKTPCYIGLAKSVIALQNYQKHTNDLSYKPKLQKGTDYMLQHKFFKRLSNDKPINRHITDLSFPESYHLNMVELIQFACDAELLHDSRTKDLIDYLKSKQTTNGTWKISFRYKAEGYTVFDKGKGTNEWLTYTIKKSLTGNTNFDTHF